jgi:hypothetical protein
MIPAISTFLSLLGAVGGIFFGLRTLWRADFKSKYPSPVTIAMQLSMIMLMTGALLADQTRTDKSGIFKYFYLFAFLAGLLTVGWSYRRLYHQLAHSLFEEPNNEEAEQGVAPNRSLAPSLKSTSSVRDSEDS